MLLFLKYAVIFYCVLELYAVHSNFDSTPRRNCRLKTLAKRAISVGNCCGAPPAAPASDDQQMQLWALASRELTWLARP